MRTEIFYFQLPDDEYTPAELKAVLKSAFQLAKKSVSKYILVETPVLEQYEKPVIMAGLLSGTIYRTFSFIKTSSGNSHVYIFAAKNLPLPLAHYKHAKTRKQVLLPLLREGADMLTNCVDLDALRKETKGMKVIAIADLAQ